MLVARTSRLPTMATSIVFCPVLASLSLLVMVVACPSVTTTLYGPKVSIELSGLVICMVTLWVPGTRSLGRVQLQLPELSAVAVQTTGRQ